MRVSYEGPRGCGHRKGGGLYLVAPPGPVAICGRLPIPLGVCPTCGTGIKPTRGTTWIDPRPLLEESPCEQGGPILWSTATSGRRFSGCGTCPLGAIDSLSSVLLLWIGEKFYPLPVDWTREAIAYGISRRIPALPRGFDVGVDWVFLAHRKTVEVDCDACGATGILRLDDESWEGPCSCVGGKALAPGIFHVFRPTAVEYVVRGDETPEDLDRLEERGIEVVDVRPVAEWGQLRIEEEDE